jgi:hypothetical protein
MDARAGTWEWKDSSQKVFLTTEDDDGSYYDDEIDYNTITSISASEMIVEIDGGSFTLKKI